MEQRRLGNLGACRRPRLCSVKASGARSRAVPPVLRLQSYPFGPMAARGTDDPHLVILSPGPAVMSADPAVGGKPGGRPTAWAVQPSWRARAARRDRHWPSSAGPGDGRNNDSVSGAGERVAGPGPQGGQGGGACQPGSHLPAAQYQQRRDGLGPEPLRDPRRVADVHFDQLDLACQVARVARARG